jgi:glycosyltransferase involved in cell wall biosynthesis
MTSSFYPPYHIGGDAIHVKYLAEELVKRGHEVHVVHSLDAYFIKRHNIPKVPDYNGVHVHSLKAPFGKLDPLLVYTLGNSSFIRREFDKLLKNESPDVVHHHNISLLGYNILKKQGGYLNLYTAHDYWLICPTNNLLKNKKELCTKRSCFSCTIRSGRPPQLWRASKSFKDMISEIDLIITPSEYLRNRLCDKIHQKSVTLYNFAHPPPANIPPFEDSNYFLFVGMLEKHKGIIELLDVFKEFEDLKEAKLLIAGTGSLEEYVRGFIEKNALQDRIEYLGFQDHERLYSLYKGARALIIPSIWPENGPLVVLEAMSCGTPVVASNLGGLPEHIEKLDRNLIFRHDDAENLKDILVETPFESLRDEAKKTYNAFFAPKRYVRGYMSVQDGLT